MGRKTYIPKMGPKKPERQAVNYVKARPPFERMLREWHARNKEYYREFKERIETGFKNDDPKVFDELMKVASMMPIVKNKDPKELIKAIVPGNSKPVSEYEWDEKKEFADWVTNDLDVAISEHINPMSTENLPAWRRLFVEDGLDDHTCAMLYWNMLDNGQLIAMMALGRAMEKEKLTAEQRAQGDFLAKGVVEKGVQTGCFHKNYWNQLLSLEGATELKENVAAVLTTVKGKGGRNADIYVLREIINGPDKHAILKNIERVVTTRKKDTDIACLLMLLVRTGNVNDDIKYKPFHDALISEFPDAGIGTERRPQQLFNNLVSNPVQLLTANTRKRCQKRMDEMREQLEIA